MLRFEKEKEEINSMQFLIFLFQKIKDKETIYPKNMMCFKTDDYYAAVG